MKPSSIDCQNHIEDAHSHKPQVNKLAGTVSLERYGPLLCSRISADLFRNLDWFRLSGVSNSDDGKFQLTFFGTSTGSDCLVPVTVMGVGASRKTQVEAGGKPYMATIYFYIGKIT